MSKPVVVIRNLEDSPDWLDRRLLAAYWRTEYRVLQPPGFVFLPGQNLPAAAAEWLAGQGLSRWALLGAWNPHSSPLPAAANADRHQELVQNLDLLGYSFLPATGAGTDGLWPPEDHCWVLDLPAEEAVRLGRLFEQNAILYWEKGGVVELWWLWQ